MALALRRHGVARALVLPRRAPCEAALVEG
jgi:hypothetical protein